ncbi:hypothetical protein V1506DRAFT_543067 [Lipomyces tetrasporus]
MSASNSHQPKRIRLGTRSCAECRRRKVRCIFSPQSSICEECFAHNMPCRAQQPRTSSSTSSNNAGSPAESLEGMQHRLQELENVVRQLRGPDKEQVELLTGVEMGPHNAIGILRPGPPRHEPVPGSARATMDTPPSAIYDTPSSTEENLEQAPLVDLFNRTLDVQSDDSTGDNHIRRIKQLPTNEYLAALKALLPRIDDLLLILESTTNYWFIWPTKPPGHDEGNRSQFYGGAAVVKDFILNSFESRQPLKIVKGILWLALCLQQVAADAIQHRKSFLPAPPQTLFDVYIEAAEAVLAGVGESVASFDHLECLLLYTKLCSNMGKPQRAWFTVRRAVNCALLLGIHRSYQCRDPVQQSLWSQAWQMDRQLSSILGVPYSVSHPQPSIDPDPPVVVRIMYHVNRIAGHISDRNQGLLNTPIEDIETEIQTCATLFPEEWWPVMPVEKDMSFDALYARQVCKMYFFQLRKTLRLPNMLKAFDDLRFEASREIAVEACRNMVSAYEVLRNSSKSALVICDLMDFITFNAALVITIHLLAPPGSRNTRRDEDDWQIITHLTQTFRQLRGAIECSVAQQAATLLEYLYTAHHGIDVGPAEYTAVIPWFGKIKVRSVPRRRETTTTSSLSQTSSPTMAPDRINGSSCSTIEVGINGATPGSGSASWSGSWGSQFADDELGIDWTSLDDIGCDYDWMQMFYGAGYEN